jgi:hypothetical protein
MNRLLSLVSVAALLSGGIIFGADSAADARPGFKTRVNHRQCRQQKRLFGGTKNGELTKREYGRLQKQQAKLAAREARMRASGNGLTRGEAARLENQQDALSKNIYQQKHDNQDRN